MSYIPENEKLYQAAKSWFAEELKRYPDLPVCQMDRREYDEHRTNHSGGYEDPFTVYEFMYGYYARLEDLLHPNEEGGAMDHENALLAALQEAGKLIILPD